MAIAVEEVLAWQIGQGMKEKNISGRLKLRYKPLPASAASPLCFSRLDLSDEIRQARSLRNPALQ